MAGRVTTRGPRAEKLDDGALFKEMLARPMLLAAFDKVRRNGGAAGGDGVSLARFSQRPEAAIGRLAHDLADGSYRPGPLRGVDIPKPSGGLRRLSIPCVIDRIAQTAAAMVLSPHLEAEFEEASFGYRPGRSVKQAVERVSALRREGFAHVVDADIDDFFDMIPHDLLLARLAESLADGPLSQLVALWLTHAAPEGRGIAQGSPLSPLMANLFLDRLDEVLSARAMRIVRFADDFVILTQSPGDAAAALERVRDQLRRLGLRLDAQKTRVTDFDKGFRFLGHLFVRSLTMKVAGEADGGPLGETDRLLAELGRSDAAGEEAGAADDLSRAAAEAKGFSPGLRNLYLLEPGRRLNIRNEAFVVEELQTALRIGKGTPETDWSEILAVPHQRLDRIDLHPGVAATPAALDHALATDTVIAYVDGHGATRGFLAPRLGERAGRHLAQAAVTLDPERRLSMARAIVEGRLRNQRSTLRKLCRGIDDPPHEVTVALSEITRLIGRGDASRLRHAASVPVLMGHEGAATAVYWTAIGKLAHADFAFATRERRTHSHAAGIALDFLAWLLHRDTHVAVLSAGLHPGFGALHTAEDRGEACVYDLMEEFRAGLIEGLFVYVTNRRILRLDMFSAAGGRMRMLRPAQEALIRAYEARMKSLATPEGGTRRVTHRRLLLEQAHAFARACETKGAYKPHVAKN